MANKAYRKGEILENIEIEKNIYLMKVKGDFTGEPGQFYMLRSEDPSYLLSRPISIYDVDEENKTISFLYAVVGRGTKEFSSLKDSIKLFGPLGNAFPKTDKKVAIVGGGIGIAPLLYFAKSLGQKPDIYLGFREDPYLVEDFRKEADKLYIATEKEDENLSGYIVDHIDYDLYDEIYACGPMAMLKSLKEKNKKADLYLSLEARMACGLGACLGCTVETKAGMKRVCKEGPIFKGEDLLI